MSPYDVSTALASSGGRIICMVTSPDPNLSLDGQIERPSGLARHLCKLLELPLAWLLDAPLADAGAGTASGYECVIGLAVALSFTRSCVTTGL